MRVIARAFAIRTLLFLVLLEIASIGISRGDEPPARRVPPPMPTHEEIEARRARIALLEAQVRRRPKEAARHVELARLYLEADFEAYAIEELERVLELKAEPKLDTEARTLLAEVILRNARAETDPARAEQAASVFYPCFAAGRDLPRESLLLFARATFLSSGRRRGDGLKKAEIARSATRTVLRADPDDLDALLQDGLYALAAGNAGEADLSFRHAIEELETTPDWPLFLSGEGGPRTDPDPATVENEAELEHWANLVRADLLYGTPERRGWETEPGALVVRYGLPRSVLTDAFEQGSADMVATRPAQSVDPTWFRPVWERLPTRRVLYRIAGKDVLFQFEDHSMRGDWRLSAASQKRSTSLAESLRTLPELLKKDEEPLVYLRAISSLGDSGRTRVDLEWARLARRLDGNDLDHVRLSYQVYDQHEELVAKDTISVPGALQLASGAHAQIWGRALKLDPGRYTLALRSRSGGRERALRPLPFVARNLGGDELCLSDLELAHPDRTSPAYPFERRGIAYLADPIGSFVRGQSFDLLFEVYNLARDDAGRVRIEAEYAVVPLRYAQGVNAAWAERAGAGGDAAELDDWRMGRLGRLPNGEPLVPGRNYYAVKLPSEEYQTGDHPLLKVVRRFELPAGLEPGAYSLLVRVRDLGAVEQSAVVGQTTLTLTE